MFQIPKAAIIAMVIAAPTIGLAQTASPSAETNTSAPSAADKDDHSYLPPGMQGQSPAADQAAAGAPNKTPNKSTQKRSRRPSRYAQDPDWPMFDD